MKYPLTLHALFFHMAFFALCILFTNGIIAQKAFNPDNLTSLDQASSSERSMPSVIFTLTNTLTPPDEYFEYLDMSIGGGAYMEQVSPGVFHIFNLQPFREYSFALKGTGPMELGVTTMDISLILMHILGYSTLDPIKLIAADATGDGRVSAADLVDIRRVLLGKAPAFGCRVSWKFIPGVSNFFYSGTTIDLGTIQAIKVGHVN